MLITTADVLRLSELNLLTSETGKTLRKLTAERDELHRRLLEAANAGQKVEASCPFRLQVNTEDKRYSPKYKDCAIELAGETAVTNWVIARDPHATEQKLALIPKAVKQILMSKPVRAMMDALKGAAAVLCIAFVLSGAVTAQSPTKYDRLFKRFDARPTAANHKRLMKEWKRIEKRKGIPVEQSRNRLDRTCDGDYDLRRQLNQRR